MKRLSLVVMLAGILLGIVMVFAFGAHHVVEALLSIGWRGFALLIVGQLVITLPLSLAWFAILPRATPRTFPVLFWGRLVREGGGRFLPFLPVGGFVMGARAVSLAGVPMPLAAASTLVDVAAEFTAEVLFAVTRIGKGESQTLGPLDRMAEQFDRIYDRKLAVAAAVLCHFGGWLGSAGMTWLAYNLLGAHISGAQALGIEALLRVAMSLTFFVPGAAGVQEAAYAGLGAIFGVAAGISVAVSLLMRARDLVIGLPALLLWQWLEFRGLRQHRQRVAPGHGASSPSGAGE